VLGLLGAGAIHPVIDRIYPLAEAAEAQRRLENREQLGKVLLQIPDATRREAGLGSPQNEA
jgi:NADPH:quinone reductase-like Zn-dependent oxidoreductase